MHLADIMLRDETKVSGLTSLFAEFSTKVSKARATAQQ